MDTKVAKVMRSLEGIFEEPGVPQVPTTLEELEALSLDLTIMATVENHEPESTPTTDRKPPNEGIKLQRLGELLSRPVVPIDWLVKDRLVAGSVSMIVSKPKVGKSTLVRNLVLAVSRGEPFLGWDTKRGHVIYLSLEERVDDVVEDFRIMGADGSEDIEIAESSTVNEVVALLSDKKPALLVVDPLFRLVRVRDEKAYAEVYAHLGPLIDAARRTGTHILCLHHSSKQPKEHAIDSPLGSTALSGAVSTLIEMRLTEGGLRTFRTVQRIGECLGETVLEFEPERKRLRLGGTREDAEVMGLKSAVLAALDGPEKLERDIDEAIEGRTSYKRRAIRELVGSGQVIRTGAGKRGDPFRYQNARSLVPTPVQNDRNNKCSEVKAESTEKLVPNISLYGGNEKTRNNKSHETTTNVAEKLVTAKSGALHFEVRL
jgi:hypothetical protein